MGRGRFLQLLGMRTELVVRGLCLSKVTEESVFVQWHDCAVEDELNFDEVVSTGAFADKIPIVVGELSSPIKKAACDSLISPQVAHSSGQLV